MTRLLKKTPVQLAGMGALASWVLRKVARDYEEEGELSSEASVAAWMLYLLHLWLTVSASVRPSKRLPVNREIGVALVSPPPSLVPGCLLRVYGSSAPSNRCRELRRAN